MAYAGLGNATDDTIRSLQASLHTLALQIQQAHAMGDPAAEADARRRFNVVKAQVDQLIAQQKAADTPGTVAQTFAQFSDWLTGTLGTAAEGVAQLPGATSRALPLLALGLGGAAVLYLTHGKRR